MTQETSSYKIIALPPELDLYNAEIFKLHVLQIIEELDTPLIIDMDKTVYMDSSGVGVLIFIFSKLLAKKIKLCFFNAQRPVYRIIELTGLNGVLPFEKTKNDALSYLQITGIR